MNQVKVALVIQNCPAGDYNSNLTTCLNFIQNAVQKGVQLIVFPEMNLTGYVTGPEIKDICRPIDDRLIELFSNLSQKHQIDILVGLAEKSANQKIFASHLIFQVDGKFHKYRKIHTAPFEQKYFSPGDDILIFESFGFKCGIQLCYDAHFPELSLAMALKNADVIFIPHASPRGTSQEKHDSWVRHLRARAFDNGLYIAACNQTGNNKKGLIFPGICLLVGPDGNIIYQSIDRPSGNGYSVVQTGKEEPVHAQTAEGIHIIKLEKATIEYVRSHKMRYFIPNRRTDLFGF